MAFLVGEFVAHRAQLEFADVFIRHL